ncbi:hypothetical protein FRX31_033791 [Thalictrum thalictroides]|uniref:Uncharacterized protein n=1 Tax=Thalictrum thalictroides TaxID=46969 RepID=A0A7J6UWS3_THATH|nr:hypothetical protein FRX31_033791 [Thalictrum thalictroides]
MDGGRPNQTQSGSTKGSRRTSNLSTVVPERGDIFKKIVSELIPTRPSSSSSYPNNSNTT